MINFSVYWKATHIYQLHVTSLVVLMPPPSHVKGGMVSDLFTGPEPSYKMKEQGKGGKTPHSGQEVQ